MLWAVLGGVCLFSAAPARAAEEVDLDLENRLAVAETAIQDGLYSIARSRIESLLSAGEETVGTDRYIRVLDLLFELLSRQEDFEAMLVRLEDSASRLDRFGAPGIARFRRAEALAGLGRQQEALEILQAAIGNDAISEAARLRLERLNARILASLSRYGEAYEAFLRLEPRLANEREKLRNRIERASVLHRAGRYRECADVLEGAMEEGVPPGILAEALLLQSTALEALDLVSEAREKLREVLDGGRDLDSELEGRLQLRLAELCLVELDHEAASDALTLARENLREMPIAAPEMRRIGRLMLELDTTLEEGIELLKARMRAAPEGVDMGEDQLAIAEALRLAGRQERAVREYQVFLESFKRPDLKCRAFWGRAISLLELELFDEAGVWFERVVEICEDEKIRAQSLYKAGDALAGAGRFSAAAQRYRRVFDEFPAFVSAPLAGVSAAESLLRIDREGEAEELLRQVMMRYPDRSATADAGLRLGELLGDRGRGDDALKILDQVVENVDDDRMLARALLARGRVHYRSLRAESALRDFDRVLQVAPELEAEALFLRANSLYWLWRDEEALEACRRLLRNYPDAPLARDAVFWLGRYHFNRNQYREAREHFERFAERWPDESWADSALLWAARSAYALDAFDDTLALLGRLFEHYPESESIPAARFLQGESLTMQARFDEALLAFESILLRHEMSDWVIAARGRKADCLFTLGKDNPARYEQSIAAYRNIAGSPNASLGEILQAEFKIGRSLEKLGRRDEALEQYYARVVVRFVEERSRGVWHDESSKAWFTRAVFHSADLLELREEWAQAARLLRRVAQVGAPGRDEARERIRRIERELLWNVGGGASPAP